MHAGKRSTITLHCQICFQRGKGIDSSHHGRVREEEIVDTFGHYSEGGMATCFCKIFLRVPLAFGLPCCPSNKGNVQKTYNKTFRTSCRFRLYFCMYSYSYCMCIYPCNVLFTQNLSAFNEAKSKKFCVMLAQLELLIVGLHLHLLIILTDFQR